MGSLVEDAVAAASWISRALTSSGYVADFGPGSLREIDRFLDEQSRDGQPTPGGLLAADTGPRLFALGAYVGEVLRRELGGEWRVDTEAPASEEGLTMVLADGSMVWPVQRVMKRYAEGPANSIAAYGLALGIPGPAATGSSGAASLVTDSCTTGWLDWVHGELWLSEVALIRIRRTLGQTFMSARRGPTTSGTPALTSPASLAPEQVTARHSRNKYIALDEIAAAALHRGRLNDRLNITMRSGVRHKLLWLRSDAASGVLQVSLARTLQDRLTLD